MNKRKQFKKYAEYYDKIYKEKDYRKEAEFLKKVIKKYSPIKVEHILSLGCGTANHDIILAKAGFKILGIDKSSEMIGIAREKAKKAGVKIDFKINDMADFKTEKSFDFAMAMFNVIGYQIKNSAMEKTLQNISSHLKKNGLFVFDCWYGSAVLKSRPENKEKEIEKELIRKTTQKLDIEKSIIDINFEVLENNIVKTEENHKMRFWYLNELEYFLEKNGFKLTKACNFLDIESKISENNWNIFIISKKL